MTNATPPRRSTWSHFLDLFAKKEFAVSNPPRRSSLDDMRQLAPERVEYFLTAVSKEVSDFLPAFHTAIQLEDSSGGISYIHRVKNACLSVGLFEESERCQRIHDKLNLGDLLSAHSNDILKMSTAVLKLIGQQPEMTSQILSK